MSNIIFEGSVVGVSFHPARDNLTHAANNGHTNFSLEHVTTNPHDDLAVAVVADDKRIGWIPKPYNKKVLHYGFDRVDVKFLKWNTYNDEVQGVRIRVEVVF